MSGAAAIAAMPVSETEIDSERVYCLLDKLGFSYDDYVPVGCERAGRRKWTITLKNFYADRWRVSLRLIEHRFGKPSYEIIGSPPGLFDTTPIGICAFLAEGPHNQMLQEAYD